MVHGTASVQLYIVQFYAHVDTSLAKHLKRDKKHISVKLILYPLKLDIILMPDRAFVGSRDIS